LSAGKDLKEDEVKLLITREFVPKGGKMVDLELFEKLYIDVLKSNELDPKTGMKTETE